jgi:hypothetical protein
MRRLRVHEIALVVLASLAVLAAAKAAADFLFPSSQASSSPMRSRRQWRASSKSAFLAALPQRWS